MGESNGAPDLRLLRESPEQLRALVVWSVDSPSGEPSSHLLSFLETQKGPRDAEVVSSVLTRSLGPGRFPALAVYPDISKARSTASDEAISRELGWTERHPSGPDGTLTSLRKHGVDSTETTESAWGQFDLGVGDFLNFTGNRFVVASQDGFCWNNEARNKNGSLLVCDNVPKPVTNVLNYAYGDPQFNTASGHPFRVEYALHLPMLTPCSANERAVAGTYDLGARPSVAMFHVCEETDKSSSRNVTTKTKCRTAVVEVHEGWSGEVDPHTESCVSCARSSIDKGKLVLDGWLMSDLYESRAQNDDAAFSR